jgi:hypothetical protein
VAAPEITAKDIRQRGAGRVWYVDKRKQNAFPPLMSKEFRLALEKLSDFYPQIEFDATANG